jgi:hypothetical protein
MDLFRGAVVFSYQRPLPRRFCFAGANGGLKAASIFGVLWHLMGAGRGRIFLSAPLAGALLLRRSFADKIVI